MYYFHITRSIISVSLSFLCNINVWLSKSCYFSFLFLVTFSSTVGMKLSPFDEPRNKCLNDWFLSWFLQEIEITFLSSKEVFDDLSIINFRWNVSSTGESWDWFTLSVVEERNSGQEKDKEESLLAPKRKFLSGDSLSRNVIQVSNWIFHRDRPFRMQERLFSRKTVCSVAAILNRPLSASFPLNCQLSVRTYTCLKVFSPVLTTTSFQLTQQRCNLHVRAKCVVVVVLPRVLPP